MGIAALAAVIGHMFPIWLKFRGGKGVATALGSFAWLAPMTVLMMVWVFVALFVVFRYVSLASILTVALFPVVSWILERSRNEPRILGIITAACLLIIAKHHQNIRRLLAGTEPRWGDK
jgi:glycerol-3-phosphate acyltransferase PlsY